MIEYINDNSQQVTQNNEHNVFLLHLENIINKESLMWFYCLGFLFADGNFSKNTNRVKMWVNAKDSDSIDKIAEFLHCKSCRYKNLAGIDFCGGNVVEQLIKKYNISNRKTYEPCDISSINGEKLIAFIVGFIDGDGTIQKRTDCNNYRIQIKMHINWQDNLEYMTNQLYRYFNISKIPHTTIVQQNNTSYIVSSWGNRCITHGLIDFIQKNNLPVLSRKWDRILQEKDIRKRSDNKSGVIGVSWDKRIQQWVAYININKKRLSLGCFNNKEDAIKTRLRAELYYCGDNAIQKTLFNKYNITNILDKEVI